jgi:integrase
MRPSHLVGTVAPQGFTPIERQRIRRAAERAEAIADAIVTTLLNTGLRVDELVNLNWTDVTLRRRSGSASIRKGKGEKAHMVHLNAAVRDALAAIRPVPVEGQVFCGEGGAFTDRGIRNLLVVIAFTLTGL